MRISEALESATKSMDSYKARLKELKIKDLIELVKDLRLVNHPEIFKTSYDVLLNKKLLPLLEEVEGYEKTFKGKGFDILRKHVYDETGFSVGSQALPSVVVRRIINEIISWSP